MITFSVITFYFIYKKFRSLLNIYLSVLLYLTSQLLFLTVISVSWVTELLHPGETDTTCQVKQGIQVFALLLPGYCILIISAVRTVFVSFPLSYFDYIRKKYQVLAFIGAVLVCGVLAFLPSFGLCNVEIHNITISNPESEDENINFCSYGKTKDCTIFYSLVLTIGMLIPDISVVILYIYTLKLAARARETHRSLTESSSTIVKETKAMREQRAIPWSIIAILSLCLVTTLPWAGMIVYTVEITEMLAEGDNLSYVFDVFYSVLQLVIGCSPLVYLLTTNSLRKELKKTFKTRSCF